MASRLTYIQAEYLIEAECILYGHMAYLEVSRVATFCHVPPGIYSAYLYVISDPVF